MPKNHSNFKGKKMKKIIFIAFCYLFISILSSPTYAGFFDKIVKKTKPAAPISIGTRKIKIKSTCVW